MHEQVCPHRSRRAAWRSFRRMRLPSAAAATHRDPVNELYDCAGELLQAARERSVAAARSGTAPALAATLGSLEAPSRRLPRRLTAQARACASSYSATDFSARPSREVPWRFSMSYGRSSIRPPAPPVRHEGPLGRSSQEPSQPAQRRFPIDHGVMLRLQSRPRRLRQPPEGDRERPPRSPISLHRPSRDPVTRSRRATSGQTPTIRRAARDDAVPI
jgi:hypothetical protein